MKQRIVFLYFSYPQKESGKKRRKRRKSHWRDVVLERVVSYVRGKHPDPAIEIVGRNTELRLERDVYENGEYTYLPGVRSPPLSTMLFAVLSFFYLTRRKPTLVYAFTYGHTLAFLGALLHCRLARTPFFVDFRNPASSLVDDPLKRQSHFDELLLEIADRTVLRLSDLIVHTNAKCKGLIQDSPNVYQKSIVAGNCAETVWHRNRADVRSRPGSTEFAYWGIMDCERELEVPIRGFAKALEKHEKRDSLLYLIGAGNALPELRRLAMDLGISENVSFRDYLPQEELVEFLKDVDVAVVPIPPHDFYEYSCPVKLGEAIALNLPVLANRIEPNRIVGEYDLGFLCEHDDEDYAKAFLRFMRSDDLTIFSSHCQKVDFLFTPEHIYRDLEASIREALESKSPNGQQRE